MFSLPLTLNYDALAPLVRRLSPGVSLSQLVYISPRPLVEIELESLVYVNINIVHICRRLLAASVSTT